MSALFIKTRYEIDVFQKSPAMWFNYISVLRYDQKYINHIIKYMKKNGGYKVRVTQVTSIRLCRFNN